MRTVFLSANKFGYELLKEVLKIDDVDVVAIVTLSKKAKTRMYDGVDNEKWHEFGLPVHEIENVNDEIELFKSLRPDIILMCGWRQIINKTILEIPEKGMIGFHPSLLPKGRGPAPVINTILEELDESGVTMFYVNEETDAGDIIGQERFPVDTHDYAKDIYDNMISKGKILAKKYLPLIAKDNAPRVLQDEKKATYFKKRTLKDNEIRLEKESPQEIYRKIRALSKPYEGAFIKIRGKKLIIWKAKLRDKND